MNICFLMRRFYVSLAIFLFSFLLVGGVCARDSQRAASRIDLRGTWQFRLAPGETEDRCVPDSFPETVLLPGTTDTNRKGYAQQNKEETTNLSRLYYYFGKAWYKRTVVIPDSWAGKSIRFVMERTKLTHVYVDGKWVGQSNDILTAQVYDLSEQLTPGTHDIAVMVDNIHGVPWLLFACSHAFSESTQTNWNGIIGQIYLEAREPLHVSDVQVYPDASSRSAWVRVKLASPQLLKEGMTVELQAEAWNTSVSHRVEPLVLPLSPSQGEYFWKYDLGDEAQLWSEFHPALYRLTVKLNGRDEQTVSFGLRDFSTSGTHFSINGHKTFLRGKHDACVFPLTGHTPMDVDTWRRYFRIAKSYGINHVRFHSWCPPEACFEAADIEGVYLQPELPYWGGKVDGSDEALFSFLHKEGEHILRAYANHASFVMFALGNELLGSQETMTRLVKSFARQDMRPLYAYGSNNNLGYRGYVPGEDYLTTCRIGGEQPNTFTTHTRASFSVTDAYDGGYLNHEYPNTRMDFAQAIAPCPVPVISHETGQYQMYPHYREIEKYRGVLYPYNMEVFRRRLEQAGMGEQAEDFFRASGLWATELYKADIEMELRTPGMGGFQLFDLQDYPGQGSAYVGVLDAFMDSKGLITPERWRGFCCEVVPLLLMDKFCWTNAEQLKAQVRIANYSESSLAGKKLDWKLEDDRHRTVGAGSLPIASPETGLLDAGEINLSLSSLKEACKLHLSLSIDGTPYRNSYSLWVYPQQVSVEPSADVLVTDELSPSVLEKLEAGARVVWFPRQDQVEEQTVGGLFIMDYWNYRMFKIISENNLRPVSPGTLGLLINAEHPLFDDFPTDIHTNWQWFPIVKQSYPLILDRFPRGYKPIVQPIDNVESNHKLGLLFEMAVGRGKLLVCMADLEPVKDKPEVRQFLHSLYRYAGSDDFRPSLRLKAGELLPLLQAKTESVSIGELNNISYE